MSLIIQKQSVQDSKMEGVEDMGVLENAPVEQAKFDIVTIIDGIGENDQPIKIKQVEMTVTLEQSQEALKGWTESLRQAQVNVDKWQEVVDEINKSII